jgi:hypothetical protein
MLISYRCKQLDLLRLTWLATWLLPLMRLEDLKEEVLKKVVLNNKKLILYQKINQFRWSLLAIKWSRFLMSPVFEVMHGIYRGWNNSSCNAGPSARAVLGI